jgi:hypothetical protein
MRRLVPFFAVLAVLALAPSLAVASFPPGFIGLSPQNSLTRADFELMQEAGVHSVRLPMFWSAIQPQNPSVGKPQWSAFDHDVALAAEYRIRIFPFLSGAPPWAAAREIQEPIETAWERWGWANFLHAAVVRYGPEGSFWEENPEVAYLPIRSWEIWDEENLVTFSYHPNPARYARLLRFSARVLHESDPGARVIAGGLFGHPLQTPPNISSGQFLSRLLRAPGIKQAIGGVALHPYLFRASEMRPEIEELRRIMRSDGAVSVPLYISEIGWGSANGPSRWDRGLYGQAEELDTAFSMLSTERLHWRIGGIWWFSWIDQVGGCQFCGSAGLLTIHREAKPSWYQFNAWTGGDPDTVPRAQFLAR